jgi:hypothetical protein
MKNFLFALRRTAYVAGALAHAQLACFHGLHSKRGFFFLGGLGLCEVLLARVASWAQI